MGGTVDVFFDNPRLIVQPAFLRGSGGSSASAVRSAPVPARHAHCSRVRHSRFHLHDLFALMGAEGHAGCDHTEVEYDRYGTILKDDDVKAKFEKLGVQVEIMDVNATCEIHRRGTRPMGEIIPVGSRHDRLNCAASLSKQPIISAGLTKEDDLLEPYSAE